MKRIKFLCILFFLFLPISVSANERIEVKFSKCVDGDTIKVLIKGKEETVRFLAIDTPETKHPKKGVEPFGKEASSFTCEKVKHTQKLELEYDSNSDKKDKYGRILAWVFTDDVLLQDELIQMGYAKVAYLYGDYSYTNTLQKHEKIAKKNQTGLWGDYQEVPTHYILILLGAILFILIFCFSKKGRKKITRKVKSEVKKQIKKEIKKW